MTLKKYTYKSENILMILFHIKNNNVKKNIPINIPIFHTKKQDLRVTILINNHESLTNKQNDI